MHKAERKRNNKNKMYVHFDLKFSEIKSEREKNSLSQNNRIFKKIKA